MGGQKGASHKRVELVLKLPQLQNLIKRDAAGYKEEFRQQHRNYMSELEIFKLKPGRDAERFAELVTFLSHVAPCYKEDCKMLPQELMALLEEHGAIIDPALRIKLVQALVLMRNRGLLNSTDLLQLFFKLFRIQDKSLRQLLFDHTVSDIRAINLKARNEKMNRTLQAFMYTMLQDESETAAKKSLDVMVELYKRRVWTDARTVNVIAAALDSSVTKLVTTALNFFLSIDAKMEEEEDADEAEGKRAPEVEMHQHAKKTSAIARKIKKQVKERKKKLNAVDEEKAGLFPAINLLNDPQGTAEKVFKRLRGSSERFEVKLLMMNFISRIISAHQLLMLPFYSFLQRYIQSHQREVTHILAYLVQACHPLVPPDDILPIIKAIAHNMVTERCSGDVMAVGINSIKEIIRRVPATLSEDGMDAFAQDIAAYAKSRDKSVVIAARGFTNLVREVHPRLLRARDRGKHHDISAQPAQYGEQKVLEGVDGAELLTLADAGILQGADEGEKEEEDGMEMDLRKIQVIQTMRADATRILTQEDFDKIKKLKAKAAEQRLDPRFRRKRKSTAQDVLSDDEEEMDTNPSLAVNAADLEGYKKRRRATLEERLESVLKGREKFEQNTHGGGLTNTEKQRKKNFLMVRKGRNLREKQKEQVRGGVAKRGPKGAKGQQQKKVQLKHDKRKKRRT
ncbi:SDA1-domain-containing protein [Tribonema minus]|uniref:Protein SDA1 n=1 Tax=Tribonema minus TaxID=303371 RepID=A0A835Z7A4_9STRA|nr:SDA1-domain-containing protein [Tribonema minus]